MRLNIQTQILLFILIGILLFSSGCGSSKKTTLSQSDVEYLDSLMQIPNWSKIEPDITNEVLFNWDIDHIDLSLNVDLNRGIISGQADYFLTGSSYRQNTIQFISGDFTIDSLFVFYDDGSFNAREAISLSDKMFKIHLRRFYSNGDNIRIGLFFKRELTTGDGYQFGDLISDIERKIGIYPKSGYRAHLLPETGFIFDSFTTQISIITSNSLTAITNGVLQSTQIVSDDTRKHVYESDSPIRFQDIGLTLGNFSHYRISNRAKILNLYLHNLPKTVPQNFETVYSVFFQPEFDSKLIALLPSNSHFLISANSDGHVLGNQYLLPDYMNFDITLSRYLSNDDYLVKSMYNNYLRNRISPYSWSDQTVLNGILEAIVSDSVNSYFDRSKEEKQVLKAKELTLYKQEAKLYRRPLYYIGTTDPLYLKDNHSMIKSKWAIEQIKNRVGDEFWSYFIPKHLITNQEPFRANFFFENVQRESGLQFEPLIDHYFRSYSLPDLKYSFNYADQSFKVESLESFHEDYKPAILASIVNDTLGIIRSEVINLQSSDSLYRIPTDTIVHDVFLNSEADYPGYIYSLITKESLNRRFNYGTTWLQLEALRLLPLTLNSGMIQLLEAKALDKTLNKAVHKAILRNLIQRSIYSDLISINDSAFDSGEMMVLYLQMIALKKNTMNVNKMRLYAESVLDPFVKSEAILLLASISESDHDFNLAYQWCDDLPNYQELGIKTKIQLLSQKKSDFNFWELYQLFDEKMNNGTKRRILSTLTRFYALTHSEEITDLLEKSINSVYYTIRLESYNGLLKMNTIRANTILEELSTGKRPTETERLYIKSILQKNQN